MSSSAPARSVSPWRPGWPAQGVAVRIGLAPPAGPLPDGVDWRAADATDPEAAADAAKGAAVIYQCLNAPYTGWPKLFPPLQRGALAAAERVRCPASHPGEHLRLRPDRRPGHDREPAAGGHHHEGPDPGRHDRRAARRGPSRPGPRRHRTGLGLLRCRVSPSPPSAPGCSPTPFPASGPTSSATPTSPHLQLRARHRRRPGHPGHATSGPSARSGTCPGPETVTTRAVLDLIAAEVGHPVGVRNVPKLAVRALGVVNPLMRELAEMAYEFEEPFVLDTTKFQSTFGTTGTPLADCRRRHRGLVPHPNEHRMTVPEAPAPENWPRELAPAAAWSQRVRRVGGFIQLAFAAFWLVRGALSLGGDRRRPP